MEGLPPMALPLITSRDNALIKSVRALHDRRARREQRAYLTEGLTLVLDALASGVQPRVILRDDSRLTAEQQARLDRALAPYNTIVQPVGPAAFRAAAATETPQGVLAVVPMPPVDDLPKPAPRDLMLIVDAVQDPGNLGTMLRAAEGAGVHWAVTTRGTVDLFSPKVVRAAMGAHFRLRLAGDVAWTDLRSRLGEHYAVVGTDSDAPDAYDTFDWTQGAAIIVGNEATGLSAEARAACTALVAIPLHWPVESLNAAVAAAVILFEAARQRRIKAG
jgi:TrmH family RNA methyltransferase